MKTETPQTIYLKDYTPHPFRILTTDMEIELGFKETKVLARHKVIPNPAANVRSSEQSPLILNLDTLTVNQVAINGQTLGPDAWGTSDSALSIHSVPETEFELCIENTICPATNTALSGLYQSSDMLCTQCEAEGFRRITPSIDRPDNLATYSVKLTGSKTDFPILLCNGNLVDSGDSGDSHFAVWDDPFPKPTYLFAVVAGNLSRIEDTFVTCSGRTVDLHFYARGDDAEKCRYAMQALKASMKWDEQVYGREYDLDLFNVVAVSDFNMGAMENKSLNIFNTKYVLADEAIATDVDFLNVEAVVAHEYFHNWSGNRVTCRDWFQLSLKEGFTVFRDQQFSADMNSQGVKRIEDVNGLRSHQFKEDSGPLAHPVRPASYMEINNFYTATVYEKGAEVVRMLHTLVGPEVFRAATDLYFERHDGQAVTTEDFVQAVQDVSGLDFDQFKNWYSQAGTPEVKVTRHYDPAQKVLQLEFSQNCPPTPESKEKQPFLIPIKIALFDSEMNPMAIDGESETVISLDRSHNQFEFQGIESEPIPSLLRSFSAPVNLVVDYLPEELAKLAAKDDDPFNRWESFQRLMMLFIQDYLKDKQDQKKLADLISTSLHTILQNAHNDPALSAKLILPPTESFIAEQTKPIDPEAIIAARKKLIGLMVSHCKTELIQTYHQNQAVNTGQHNHTQTAARSLRDACLYLLSVETDSDAATLGENQFTDARCMTDSMSSLSALVRMGHASAATHLESFLTKWADEPLVVDKWLRVQAIESGTGGLEQVSALIEHPAFDIKNPNKVYSLLLAFSHGNLAGFHLSGGQGYEFIANQVLKLDAINPQVAARLVSAFNNWRNFKPELGQRMSAQLERISAESKLSNDVREIVTKALGK